MSYRNHQNYKFFQQTLINIFYSIRKSHRIVALAPHLNIRTSFVPRKHENAVAHRRNHKYEYERTVCQSNEMTRRRHFEFQTAAKAASVQ